MSTFMPKVAEIERKWYILDAAGKPLGRVAARNPHLGAKKENPPQQTSLGRMTAIG